MKIIIRSILRFWILKSSKLSPPPTGLDSQNHLYFHNFSYYPNFNDIRINHQVIPNTTKADHAW